MNGLVLAPQAQVPFLVPKIGTQNDTLDSDIEERCSALPRPVNFWPCPNPPCEEKTFPVHP